MHCWTPVKACFCLPVMPLATPTAPAPPWDFGSFQEHKAESPAAPFFLAGCALEDMRESNKKFLLSLQEASRAYRGGKQISGVHFPRCFAEKLCNSPPSVASLCDGPSQWRQTAVRLRHHLLAVQLPSAEGPEKSTNSH